MKHLNLASLARALPAVWRSSSLAHIGNANLKVLRMDESAHAEEVHGYDEALLVLEGTLNLMIADRRTTVRQHELCIIPAGSIHRVLAGSCGSLMIVDLQSQA